MKNSEYVSGAKHHVLQVITFSLLFFLCSFSPFYSIPSIKGQEEDNSVGVKSTETLTQPKERIVKVTASVQDATPPTTPVLIAPANKSILATNTPLFVWKGSTDEFGMSHYILTLDGSGLFTSIPLASTENGSYKLTYDSTTGYYSLLPKTALADGTHTWKVTAVDEHDNVAHSVTWTFTIDSQSPVFVITKIDGIDQSISAQDSGTVPTEPVVLTNNEPILEGTGEAKSTVELIVMLPSGESTSYTFSVSDSGTWQVQLGTLPRDQIIYLDFRTTDKAGHISVIDNVPLILKTPKVVLPQIPLLPPLEEPIEIPIYPPKEVIPEIIIPLIPPAIGKYMSIFPVISPTPRAVQQFAWTSILVLLLIATLPILKTLLLILRFGRHFSLAHLLEIWQVIGLIPGHKPQGIAVYRDTQEPLAYAKVTFSGKLDTYRHSTITKLTNQHGIYSPSQIPDGTHQVLIEHPQILFPTLVKKPTHLSSTYYYQGQEFTRDKDHVEPNLIIPVDFAEKKATKLDQAAWWILNQPMANRYILAVSIVLCIFSWSGSNFIATILYALCLVYHQYPFTQHKLTDQVLSIDSSPLLNVIIMTFSAQDPTLLQSITQSSDTGQFRAREKDAQVILTATDFSFKPSGVSGKETRLLQTELQSVIETSATSPISIIFDKA